MNCQRRSTIPLPLRTRKPGEPMVPYQESLEPKLPKHKVLTPRGWEEVE